MIVRRTGTTAHLRIKFTLFILYVSLGVSLFKAVPHQQDILQWILLLLTFIPAGLLWVSFLNEMELSLSFPLISPILVAIPLWDWFILKQQPNPVLGLAAILILSGIILLENPYQDKERLF